MNSTIVALATASGVGAIAVIRLSGQEAIAITDRVFGNKQLKSKQLISQKPNTIHFGVIHDEGTVIDEVLVSLFKSPQSYTGEHIIEISCHGSPYIQQQIIQLLIRQGATMAEPGEFTQRAFLNGKLDLSQAEAVADLIASNSAASHQLAMQQMKGGFSNEIERLRNELIHFASLIELELDFGEEDVEFANRTDLQQLIEQIITVTDNLYQSFAIGNVMKQGVPVAIVGRPNAGKSTLLNALLNEDRAIVSAIAGTTRDTIEETMTIGGIIYRFIDTAGIREATDTIEAIGVEKAIDKAQQAAIVIYLFDVHDMSPVQVAEELDKLNIPAETHIILVGNKIDTQTESAVQSAFPYPVIFISAKEKYQIEQLTQALQGCVQLDADGRHQIVVTNARHAEALYRANESLRQALNNLKIGISGDLVAMDIRMTLHYMGLITGKVSPDDLLKNIFSRFCIGK